MKRLAKRIMIGVAAFLALLLLYGVLVEPRLILDEESLDAQLPALGEDWAGAEIAVFSDLQVGMWFANTGMIERVVDRVLEAEPVAVLIGGDFVYSSDPNVATQINNVLDLLAPLVESGIPVYAVLGNHDYAVGAAEELTVALRNNGVQVLRNESATVPSPGEDGGELHIVGVGPARPGRADVDQALEGVPEDAPRLVLMHNPTSFPEFPPGSAPLALAGHTHCGQIAIPGQPRWSYLGLTEEEALVADGFAFPDYGARGNRLFVTCGIGFSLLPIRINAPPQLVFVKLVPT